MVLLPLRSSILFAPVIALTSAVSAGAAPASAAPVHHRSYSIAEERYSPSLGQCIRITLWGRITFQLQSLGKTGTFYRNVRMRGLAMRVSALDHCGGSKADTMRGAKLVQRWYPLDCGLKADAEASYPWAIGAAVRTKCGTQRFLRNTTSYPLKAEHYTQHNTGAPVFFKGRALYRDHRGARRLCLGAGPYTTVYRGSSSTEIHMAMKACVRP